MDRSEIKHIAEIAMLSFTDEELDNFAKSFSDTMDFINNIKNIPTFDIETKFQVNEMENNLRKDVIEDGLTQKEATMNTETEKYGYFEIMKFVE